MTASLRTHHSRQAERATARARAATTTTYYSGNQISDLDTVGWHAGNSERKLHPVGQLVPNAFGLYDMHGNIRESSATSSTANPWRMPSTPQVPMTATRTTTSFAAARIPPTPRSPATAGLRYAGRPKC